MMLRSGMAYQEMAVFKTGILIVLKKRMVDFETKKYS
jgi:hypothetical protein